MFPKFFFPVWMKDQTLASLLRAVALLTPDLIARFCSITETRHSSIASAVRFGGVMRSNYYELSFDRTLDVSNVSKISTAHA
jgi:hypothetical protein